jgi:BCD family chlorophyll transporter-like MFS transporter
LLEISATLSILVVVVTGVCLWGLEGRVQVAQETHSPAVVPKQSFKEALANVWSEPQAKASTVFVFLSMLAYSSQDLVLEPFAGALCWFDTWRDDTAVRATPFSSFMRHVGGCLGWQCFKLQDV